MTLVIIAGAFIAGAVVGVLFGRKNKSLVEKELADVKAAAAKAGIKLQ